MDFYRLSLYWIVYDIVNSVTTPHEVFITEIVLQRMIHVNDEEEKTVARMICFFFALNQDALRTNRFSVATNWNIQMKFLVKSLPCSILITYSKHDATKMFKRRKKVEREYLNIYHWNWMLLMYLYSVELLQQCATNKDKNRSMHGNHVFGTVVGYMQPKGCPVYILVFLEIIKLNTCLTHKR